MKKGITKKMKRGRAIALITTAITLAVALAFPYDGVAASKDEDFSAAYEEIETESVEDESLSLATDAGKDGYYSENSEVVKVINASKSKDAPAEEEVIAILSERGFPTGSITYEYRMGGEYRGERRIKGEVGKKRPFYQIDYYSAKGELWTVYVINGTVIANPVTYNVQSNLSVPVLISETKEITSYDHTTDSYYVTIPKDSAVIVKTVKKIDAATLDNLTCEAIDKK